MWSREWVLSPGSARTQNITQDWWTTIPCPEGVDGPICHLSLVDFPSPSWHIYNGPVPLEKPTKEWDLQGCFPAGSTRSHGSVTARAEELLPLPPPLPCSHHQNPQNPRGTMGNVCEIPLQSAGNCVARFIRSFPQCSWDLGIVNDFNEEFDTYLIY